MLKSPQTCQSRGSSWMQPRHSFLLGILICVFGMKITIDASEVSAFRFGHYSCLQIKQFDLKVVIEVRKIGRISPWAGRMLLLSNPEMDTLIGVLLSTATWQPASMSFWGGITFWYASVPGTLLSMKASRISKQELNSPDIKISRFSSESRKLFGWMPMHPIKQIPWVS